MREFAENGLERQSDCKAESKACTFLHFKKESSNIKRRLEHGI